MAIEWSEKEMQLKDLKEYNRNPRYINKEEFTNLVKSLKEDGYHQRLLVNYDNTIIGGHQRKRAFKEAGFKDSDKILVLKPNRQLTEEEFKRINIRDNLDYGTWDFEILGNDFDFHELLEIGFSEDLLPSVKELDKLEKEIGIDEDFNEQKEKKHKCPECGHEF